MMTKLMKMVLVTVFLISGTIALCLSAAIGGNIGGSKPENKNKPPASRTKADLSTQKLAKSKLKTIQKIEKSSVMPQLVVDSNYIKYDTIERLDQNAQVILIGTPLKDFLDREHVVTRFSDGHLQDFYTLTDIKIQKIIKKPADFNIEAEQTLEIVELLSVLDEGKSGKVKLVRENYQELRKGSKYILFLKKGGKDKYSIINMNLGKFNMDGTDLDDLGDEDKTLQREEKLKFKKEVFKKYGDKLK